MFQNEERRLINYKSSIDEIEIPADLLNTSIQEGFQKAKREKQKQMTKKKRWIWTAFTAAILLITLVTSIRVSPVFASQVASIPGMGKIVELINHDKGLMSAVENEYMQAIGVSETQNGITLSIDSAIYDQQGMVLFYTVKADETQSNLMAGDVSLTDGEGNELPIDFSMSGSPGYEDIKEITVSAEYLFSEPLYETEFIFNADIESSASSESFSIPFNMEVLEQMSRVYEINETIEVEGQKLFVENITIHPIRTAVKIKADPENTKKIFHFDSIQLVDEKGGTWSKTSDGIQSSGDNENGWEVYLESNYFEQFEELYLEIGEIQAVDKDHPYVVIDTENMEIVSQPKENFFLPAEIEDGYFFIKLKGVEDFRYFLFGEVRDADGKEFNTNGSSLRSSGLDARYGFELPTESYTDPLTVQLTNYPSRIKGDVRIKININSLMN
ncbi:DUF4179 domain-containing protein [Jeotgalibacillus proteolyticus]|uniref:DUF4179 domain-containing protein n=1 Tax=Jeotgalibacillus proteolyticus TaxID=2082395 RepID=A0A2S5G7G0_9BACL|nr:DUF4179 domain-containing protein [Jeotgalibacillus proteolyticus]PPA68922.1 hypothetical protein C4B60_18580 [Jeotgalibacillus proteolyticus]